MFRNIIISIIAGLICPAIFASTRSDSTRLLYSPDNDDPTAEFPLFVLAGWDEAAMKTVTDELVSLEIEGYVVAAPCDIDAIAADYAVDPSRIYGIALGTVPRGCTGGIVADYPNPGCIYLYTTDSAAAGVAGAESVNVKSLRDADALAEALEKVQSDGVIIVFEEAETAFPIPDILLYHLIDL